MYRKIMVPLDGSELAECVLPHVEAIARGCAPTTVIFLRVAEPVRVYPGATTLGGEYTFTDQDWKQLEVERWAATEDYLKGIVGRVKYDGVSVRSEVLMGEVAEGIADYATKNDADLIIMATHGRSGISRWVLGSVADRVLRSSCVPVLMVRAPGCEPRA
ncbi:MAG: universal stress protein [Dehalococcoidia bacterium]